MSDDENKKKDPKTENGMNKPPFQTLFFWIVLISLPIVLFTLSKNKDYRRQTITASELDKLIEQKKVSNVIIYTEKLNSVYEVQGEMFAKEIPPEEANQENTETDSEKSSSTFIKFRVNVISITALEEKLAANNIKREIKPRSNFMTEMLSVIIPLLFLILIIYFLFSRQLRNAGKGAMQFGKSKARLLTPASDKITFKDVAGINEARSEVEEIVDFLKDPEKYRDLGGRLPKGCLMVGPPGTGKTLLAKAIAGEADVPFFSISGSDFVEMFVGVGASRVRDMFEQAKKHQPCILFIDEIDAVGRTRFSGNVGGGHDEREQTLNALLVEMDGFEDQHGVIVLAATNRADVLDPALLRPGRFDRRISVDLPDLKGRYEILKVHSKKIKLDSSVELPAVARGTAGFSGADLANVINESALLAAGANQKAVKSSDLEEARDKVRWGKERKSRKMSDDEQENTAYHEAGHTLVGLYCEKSTPLHKVTIIPRGNAYLGATMNLPERDKYTQTKSELQDELCVLMGGRIAEEIHFGEITNGASSDISRATDICKAMICQWGMSENLGFIKLQDDDHGNPYMQSNSYSEKTLQEIDLEIKNLLNSAYKRAKKILTDNKDQLIKLSKELLVKETMSANEVRELLGMERRILEDIDFDFEDEAIETPQEETSSEDKKKETEKESTENLENIDDTEKL